jgi:hypothetical protein
MTALSAAAALRLIAGRIEAGQIPAPSPLWPIVFRAADADQARTIAASLGITGPEVKELPEEDGSGWLRLSGETGGLRVQITASTEPVLLDPLGEPESAWSLAGVTS